MNSLAIVQLGDIEDLTSSFLVAETLLSHYSELTVVIFFKESLDASISHLKEISNRIQFQKLTTDFLSGEYDITSNHSTCDRSATLTYKSKSKVKCGLQLDSQGHLHCLDKWGKFIFSQSEFFDFHNFSQHDLFLKMIDQNINQTHVKYIDDQKQSITISPFDGFFSLIPMAIIKDILYNIAKSHPCFTINIIGTKEHFEESNKLRTQPLAGLIGSRITINCGDANSEQLIKESQLLISSDEYYLSLAALHKKSMIRLSSLPKKMKTMTQNELRIESLNHPSKIDSIALINIVSAKLNKTINNIPLFFHNNLRLVQGKKIESWGMIKEVTTKSDNYQVEDIMANIYSLIWAYKLSDVSFTSKYIPISKEHQVRLSHTLNCTEQLTSTLESIVAKISNFLNTCSDEQSYVYAYKEISQFDELIFILNNKCPDLSPFIHYYMIEKNFVATNSYEDIFTQLLSISQTYLNLSVILFDLVRKTRDHSLIVKEKDD